MNKYKDMSNTELIEEVIASIRRHFIFKAHNDSRIEEETIIRDELLQEVYSRMIPRESIKLTVK